jgi:2',3'-cyclic-nucleotide 2'-phosphodiesterase/3'-nucleotidase
VVATNNYRGGGGGNFPEIGPDKVIFQAPDTNRDVIVRYIVEQRHHQPVRRRQLELSYLLKARRCCSATGPKARDFVDDVEGVANRACWRRLPTASALYRIKL